jgi:hypothetical protein
MPLRRSPLLTPRALAARRANALKSTGPRTAAGKARSCLNALRHGRRAHDLRAKLERTGDLEALYMLDWFHAHIVEHWQPRNERWWSYTVRLAARVWCFMNGRSQPRPAPSVALGPAGGAKQAYKTYQYGDGWRRPRQLQIAYKRGPGIRFVNPTPTRRKHVLMGWLPKFEYLPGPPPRAKRVRSQAGVGSSPSPDAAPSDRCAGALWGGAGRIAVPSAGVEPPAETEMAKNQVRMKLESPKESIAYYNFEKSPAGTLLQPSGESLEALPEDWNLDGAAGGSAAFSSGEVIDAGDDPFVFGSLNDADGEDPPALHPLLRLQWEKWRQALMRFA